MKPVRWRPQALRDAELAAAWYARQGGQAVELAFVDALHAVTHLVGQFPGSGSGRHAIAVDESKLPLRFLRLAHFERYLFYYLDLPNHVEVMRIWDCARGLDALLDATDLPPTTEEP